MRKKIKKLVVDVSTWWNREKWTLQQWKRLRRAERRITSPKLKKYRANAKEELLKITEMNDEIQACEDATEEFIFVSSMSINADKLDLYCYPERMDQMTALLRWFAQKDYRQIKDSKETSDDKYRCWYLDKIEITAWFKSDDPVACKYIDDGVREVPKYKMVCPGDPDYPKDE